MIVRARTVVTMNGPPIDNGAVAVAGDRIAAVGTFDQIKRGVPGDVIDLGDQILLPGLINAHCHLDYTAFRGRIPPRRSFSEWVGAINAEKERFSADDYLRSIRAGITEAQQSGTTSMVNLEAFPALARQIQSPLRIWWLAELIDVRAPEGADDLLDSAVQSLKHNEHWGLAPHSPYTASRHLFQQSNQIATRENTILSTHVAESSDEMTMFRHASGPLHQFLQSIGRDMTDCGRQTALAQFLQVLTEGPGVRNANMSRWIVAHLNELDQTDFALLNEIESKFHVVHCPRSSRYFKHARFAFEPLRQLGFNISLGTDSLASNDDLNLFGEMQQFSKIYPDVSGREIFEMVTINPAKALNRADQLGRIAENFLADLVAIEAADSDLFENVVQHQGPVNWLMTGGRVPTP